jgi:hypothetical protein
MNPKTVAPKAIPVSSNVVKSGLRVFSRRSYAIVEDCKNKGIESYIGGKDLCLSHFGYTS